jgi:hypothetical protein
VSPSKVTDLSFTFLSNVASLADDASTWRRFVYTKQKEMKFEKQNFLPAHISVAPNTYFMAAPTSIPNRIKSSASSILPGASFLAALTRYLIPSNQYEKNKKWKCKVFTLGSTDVSAILLRGIIVTRRFNFPLSSNNEATTSVSTTTYNNINSISVKNSGKSFS